MLDRAITEAAQASAMALFCENRFLNNFAVIPDMNVGTITLREYKQHFGGLLLIYINIKSPAVG